MPDNRRNDLVAALRERDGDNCGICGEPLAGRVDVDHVRPLAAGGHASDLANLQLTHARCNRSKQGSYEPQHLWDLGVPGDGTELLRMGISVDPITRDTVNELAAETRLPRKQVLRILALTATPRSVLTAAAELVDA